MNQSKKLGLVIGVVVLATIGYVAVSSNKETSDQMDSNGVAQNTPENGEAGDANAGADGLPPADTTKSAASETETAYKDGTYSATGSYMSPDGLDHISVTLTLSKDIVTDISATSGAGDKTSEKYQGIFLAGFKQYVVGQNIAGVHLTKVSGSSLTSGGFNDALAQIKTSAKV